MQYDGKIVGKVFPKGLDGKPNESAPALAVYAIGYNGSAVVALQAVVNDMVSRSLDLINEQVII